MPQYFSIFLFVNFSYLNTAMKALYESGWIVLVQLRTGSYVDLVKMDQLRAEHEFVTFST